MACRLLPTMPSCRASHLPHLLGRRIPMTSVEDDRPIPPACLLRHSGTTTLCNLTDIVLTPYLYRRRCLYTFVRPPTHTRLLPACLCTARHSFPRVPLGKGLCYLPFAPFCCAAGLWILRLMPAALPASRMPPPRAFTVSAPRIFTHQRRLTHNCRTPSTYATACDYLQCLCYRLYTLAMGLFCATYNIAVRNCHLLTCFAKTSAGLRSNTLCLYTPLQSGW